MWSLSAFPHSHDFLPNSLVVFLLRKPECILSPPPPSLGILSVDS